MRSPLLIAALLGALPAGALDIEYVAVRDADNAPDTVTHCGNQQPDCGSVPYDYAISKYEVTNAQYVAFLNEVANEVDTFGLYNPLMPYIDFPIVPPNTERFYVVQAGFENHPVVYVSWHNAARFANWLHNGQPRGLQDETTTEDGAYTITADGISQNTVIRNAGARVFIPSENEWYKAAYYDPTLDGGLGGFYAYPAGSDEQTTCTVLPFTDPNTANCGPGVANGPVDVGSYLASPSPYGTFDQGGNAWEWTQDSGTQDSTVSLRIARGGAWGYGAEYLGSQSSVSYIHPAFELNYVGFRVARPAPEPAQVLLLLTGGLVLAAVGRKGRA